MRVVELCCVLLGPPAAAWGGYGLGVAVTAGGAANWAGAAGLLSAGAAACVVATLSAARWPASAGTPRTGNSFAEDVTALERLAASAAAHPEGLATLQDLADLLFEVHHPAAPAPAPAADVVRDAGKGVRTDA